MKLVFFHDMVDPAGAWLRDGLLPGLAGLPGVTRVVWWRARRVPQPEDVSRPLNAVTGMGEVFAPEATLVTRVLPMLRDLAADVSRVTILRGVVCDEEPEYDLIRDVPAQQHPYFTLPVDWKSGRRIEVPEPTGEDLYRYVYFFAYRDEVSFDAGEDWYLGHHTREGRQLPGLVRYLTWRRRRPAGAAEYDRDLLGLVRYTELCFESFERWYDACYRHGPRWRMPEEHPKGVWHDYHAFFLGPEPEIDLTVPSPRKEAVD